MKQSKGEPPHLGEGLSGRRLRVRAADVVYVKGVLEASEGLAQVFSESGGELLVAAPDSRLAELDQVLLDLSKELGLVGFGAAEG